MKYAYTRLDDFFKLTTWDEDVGSVDIMLWYSGNADWVRSRARLDSSLLQATGRASRLVSTVRGLHGDIV